MNKQTRTAIYSRVSTADQQTLEMQTEACRNYVKARGWTETMCVAEIASGAKDNRPKRKHIIEAAQKREIDIIIVWKLDRWGRSTNDIISTLKLFEEIKVIFVSVTDTLDFSTTTGKAMVGLIAIFANFERDLLRDRVISGIHAARKRGQAHGRPDNARILSQEMQKMWDEGKTHSQIAATLNVSRASVYNFLGGARKSKKQKAQKDAQTYFASSLKNIVQNLTAKKLGMINSLCESLNPTQINIPRFDDSIKTNKDKFSSGNFEEINGIENEIILDFKHESENDLEDELDDDFDLKLDPNMDLDEDFEDDYFNSEEYNKYYKEDSNFSFEKKTSKNKSENSSSSATAKAKKQKLNLIKNIKIHIFFRDIGPKIWRDLIVPATATLYDLHYYIQAAFGWEAFHLHKFYCYKCEQFDEDEIYLKDLIEENEKSFCYEYDFGDNWIIEIKLSVPKEQERTSKPTCIDGKRAAPPEDCGGAYGYHELCHAMKRKSGQLYRRYKSEFGAYNPEKFSKKETNEDIKEWIEALERQKKESELTV